MKTIPIEATLRLTHNALLTELTIVYTLRQKEEILQIMKTAHANPDNIHLKLVIKDKLKLQAKIVELENYLKQLKEQEN